MQLLILLGLVATAAARSSTSSFCIPTTPDSTVPVPACLDKTISAITSIAPSFSTDISIIEGIDLSSPSFDDVETIIAGYERTYSTEVSKLESYLSSPSLVTSSSYFYELETHFPTLETAISVLISAESAHPSLSLIQTTLQTVFVYVPSAVTVGTETFACSHNYLRTAETEISEVTLTSPSIVSQVNALTTIFSTSPAVDDVLTVLSIYASKCPSIISELTTATSWVSTSAWHTDKTLISLKISYPTLYTEVVDLDSFISKHTSIATDVTDVVSAMTVVPSIISAVATVVTAVSPSFTAATKSLASVVLTDTDLTTQVTYLDLLEASHPSLECAESTIEKLISSHASTVYLIETAISSPSTVRSPALVSHLESLYPSIVTAYHAITSAESSNPYLVYVQTALQTAEVISSTVLTAADQVASGTSPSVLVYASSVAKAISISPTITSAISSWTAITFRYPSLSCDEDVIESYAVTSPSIIYSISKALSSPSSISPSSLKSIEELTAHYPSLVTALRTIISYEKTYPSLKTIETALTYVMSYEPSIISVYTELTYYEAEASCALSSTVPLSAVTTVTPR